MLTEKMILLERCVEISGRSRDWWEENIGKVPTEGVTYTYRKRGAKVLDIKSVIEIPNNSVECIVLLYDGEEIITKGKFADVYDEWVERDGFDENDYYDG